MAAYPDPADENLLRCWRRQECNGCLDERGCSWCPFVSLSRAFSGQFCRPCQSSLKRASRADTQQSWSCVPNNYTISALAPAYDENICPHWAERWEIRTRPLGCQVSTITSLTSIVSVASTLVFALLVTLMIFSIRALRRYHKRQESGWWKLWRWDWGSQAARLKFWPRSRAGRPAEQEPLLED